MLTFTLEKITLFQTLSEIYLLWRNDRCYVREFRGEIMKDKNLINEWYQLMAILEDVANNKLLPETRYRKLKLGTLTNHGAFEVKSKHLRLYLITEHHTGKILVCAGKKKNQKRDVGRLKRIIYEYKAFTEQRKKR
jgi:hypothetical protein